MTELDLNSNLIPIQSTSINSNSNSTYYSPDSISNNQFESSSSTSNVIEESASETGSPNSNTNKRTKHRRRPSRAERYESLVEGARRLSLKGINDRIGEDGEVHEPVGEDEWRECVTNLLLVVDGMTRQLSTHDELAAQLKIARSNLTLAETHSDYLEETLRRNSASTRSNHVRSESNGSSILVGVEDTTEPSRGFFSRMPTTRKKTPSIIASSTMGGSLVIENSSNNISNSNGTSSPRFGGNELDSTRRVSELTSEIVTLRELADKFRLGEESASKSKEVLEKKCGELEKTTNDLMEELENLSVELFQEANTMVAEERKARSKAEEESLSLKEEIERMAREIELLRGGEDYGGGTEGLRRAEQELEQALGLHSEETSKLAPINTNISITKSSTLSNSDLNMDLLTPDSSTHLLSESSNNIEEDKSPASGRSWFNFNLSGLKKKSSTSDFSASTTPLTDDLISPTATRNSSLTVPSSSTTPTSLQEFNDNTPNLESRRSSHLSDISTMTTDSNTSSHVSNSFSDASTSAPFPDDLELEERDASVDSFESERKAYREEKEKEKKREKELENVEVVQSTRNEASVVPTIEYETRTPTAASPTASGPITPLATIFPTSTSFPSLSSSSTSVRTLSPEPIEIEDEFDLSLLSKSNFSNDFPPEAAYPSSELHGNLASFYPLPPSPTMSSFSFSSNNSNSSFNSVPSTSSLKSSSLRTTRTIDRNIDTTSSSTSTATFFTPPTSNNSTFNSIYTPPNSLATIDSSGEETPKKVQRRPLPIPIDSRSNSSNLSSSTPPSSSSDSATTPLKGLTRRPSAAAMVLQSLNEEGKITPKSPNLARWRKASVGLASPPLGNTLSISRRSSAGTSGSGGDKSPTPTGNEWGRSSSEPSIPTVSILNGSNQRALLPIVSESRSDTSELTDDRREEFEVAEMIEEEEEAPVEDSIRTKSYGDVRRELNLPTSMNSSNYISSLATTTSTTPVKSSNSTTNSVPLPPGTTSSSYTGISPSNSFRLGPSISNSSSTTSTKSLSSTANGSNSTSTQGGGIKGSAMVDDLDLLMRNIVAMSENLFGDDLEDEDEILIRSDDEEDEDKLLSPSRLGLKSDGMKL